MINYGYFRHRFNAHLDEKLLRLVDEMGVEAYGYYYTLLEIYGASIAGSDEKNFALIHERVIANAWRKRVDSCNKVVTKLQLSGLLVFTLTDSTYQLSIPNFLKYYGSYQKNAPQKLRNKIKEKKRKENKRISKPQEHETDVSATRIVELFNAMLSSDLPAVKTLSEKRKRAIKTLCKLCRFEQDWENYFQIISKTDFLLGRNDRNWRADFDWIINQNNFIKVTEGKYGEVRKQGHESIIAKYARGDD